MDVVLSLRLLRQCAPRRSDRLPDAGDDSLPAATRVADAI